MHLFLTSLTLPEACAGVLAGATVAAASRLLERAMTLAPTPLRRLPLEVVLPAAWFALVGAQFGPTQESLIRWFWIAVLTQVLFFDLRHRLILDAVVLPAIVAAVLLSPFGQTTNLAGSIVGGVAAGLLFLLIALVAARRYGTDALGLGDVKLAALIGAMLGIAVPGVNAVRAIVLGLLLGAVFVAIQMALGRLSRRDAVPLGPFLCGGALAVLALPPDAWWPFG